MSRRSRLRAPTAAFLRTIFWRRCRCRPSPIPPSTAMRLRAATCRTKEEQAFPVIGRVQAGGVARRAGQAGQAMRIFTGAPMPEGADTVFMQEDVRVEGDKVVLPAGLKPGANVRPAGEDIRLRRCRAEGRPAAAAAGCRACRGLRPDAARCASGAFASRCSPPATNWPRRAKPRAAAQLFDSNRFMLMAMLARLGCEVSDLGILRDDRASLARALQEVAGTHDLILTTGGVSTGEEDHVKAERRKRRQAGAVADGDQAGTPRRDGDHRRHAVHRIAGKSGGEFCHLRSRGAADHSGAVRRAAGAVAADAGSRRLQLQEEDLRAANMSASACARPPTARWKRSNFRARARACCRRWWTPTAWSNSARRSRRSSPARWSDSCPMRA